MRLIIASNNAHKIREIREIIGPYFTEMCSLKEAGIDIDVVEDGKTFQENAVKKAEEVLKVADGFDAALADDSGLIVDALGGAPGIYSARYAGEGHDDTQNKARLLKELDGVPEQERTARFASACALARKGRETVCVIGYVEGRILFEESGKNGFGYDPLFYYPPFHKSFAEISAEDKNSVSHRHNSLTLLKEVLEKEQK